MKTSTARTRSVRNIGPQFACVRRNYVLRDSVETVSFLRSSQIPLILASWRDEKQNRIRTISRKGAKHVLTEVEGSVKAENSLADVN
jgi:hypothetical protein